MRLPPFLCIQVPFFYKKGVIIAVFLFYEVNIRASLGLYIQCRKAFFFSFLSLVIASTPNVQFQISGIYTF